jgi:molybdopterin-containing oxidoreductase family membrane subunit
MIVLRLKTLLGQFVAVLMYFVLIYHLTNLYFTGRHDFERFILVDGGIYTTLFWLGQVLVGGILPLVLLFHPVWSTLRWVVAAAAVCVILGGLAQIYVIIIGGQAYPLVVFPGKEVASRIFDGVIATYAPSLPEVALGVGGIALALVLTAMALKVLPLLPRSLADNEGAKVSPGNA